MRASPGPGYYETSIMTKRPYSAISTQFSTPKHSRSIITNKPGSNNENIDNNNFSFKIKERKNFVKLVTPGPGDYKTNKPDKNPYKGITIPKAVQPQPNDEEINPNLAPGYYKINDECVKKRNYQCRIRPPKPPQRGIDKVIASATVIQNKPTIQIPNEFERIFKTLDYKNLDVINNNDMVSP